MKKILLILTLLFASFLLGSCAQQSNLDGGWVAPVFSAEEENAFYLLSADGYIDKFAYQERGTFINDVNFFLPQSAEGSRSYYAQPVLSGGNLYTAGYLCSNETCQTVIQGINPTERSLTWRQSQIVPDANVNAALAIHEDVLLIGLGHPNTEEPTGSLIALDSIDDFNLELKDAILPSARELWRIPVEGEVSSGVTVADGIAYLGTSTGRIYAIDLKEIDSRNIDPISRILWTFDVGTILLSKPVVTESGKLIIGTFSYDNSLYGLDIETRESAKSGTEIDSTKEWANNYGDWVASEILVDSASPTLGYVSTLRGDIYKIELESGENIWAQPAETGANVVGKLNLYFVGQDQRLIVPSTEGDVYIVSATTGAVDERRFITGGWGVYSQPLFIGETIFVHATDSAQSRIYSFSPASLDVFTCTQLAANQSGECQGGGGGNFLGNIWQTVFLEPIFNTLGVLYAYLFNNLIVAILAFTIIIRLLLLPLQIKQTNSMKKMQTIQPQIKSIQEKYKKDKSPDARRKMSSEISRTYKQAGVSPIGCLGPLIVQLPIWIAFYQVILRTLPVSPEGFVNLINFLYSWNPVAGDLPINAVYGALNLRLNVSDTPFPLNFTIPILVGLTLFIQQKVSSASNTSDTSQRTTQRLLLWMLPILFAFFTWNFSAALAIYILLSNVVGIILQFIISPSSAKNFYQSVKSIPRTVANMRNPQIVQKQDEDSKVITEKEGDGNEKTNIYGKNSGRSHKSGTRNSKGRNKLH